MKVQYYLIKDVQLNSQARSVEELSDDPNIRHDQLRYRHCITSVCAGDGKVYCGCTNTAGDILYEFTIATGKFRCLNFQSVAEPCDMKIHRGLWLDRKRNCLVFGIATLAPTSKTSLSDGARIMKFDLKTEKFSELIRPMPGNYIQAAIYDADRQMAYSFTEPSQGFAISDLAKGVNRWARAVGSIVHTSTIDPAGGVWGTWGFRGKHPFFRYDPTVDKIEFFENLAIPTSAEACNLMYPGAGPIDCMITGPDNMVWLASALGELYRLDPAAKKVDYIGRPVPHIRLPGLVFGPDGNIYGVGGTDWNVTLWRYDRKADKFQVLGDIAAEDGRRCFRPHDITFVDGRFYVGETDNPKVSGCLWAVTV
jgi:hypothetical protein